MIGVVDYGLGNVRAFTNIYNRLNVPVMTAADEASLRMASKIILPGVGSFDDAMSRLERSGMLKTLTEMVLEGGVPLLGVCVGMQMLGEASEEGSRPGLGWISGEVKRFPSVSNGEVVRSPHMGWNTVKPDVSKGLFEGLDANSRFYFLHSYYFNCRDKETAVATTDYHGEYASSVKSGNIYGVQFHPEKSHSWGLRLLNNFAKVV